MSEPQSFLSTWPDWARMALFYALLPFIVLAMVFGKGPAIFMLCGSLIVFQTLSQQNFAGHTRKDSPWVFWFGAVIFSIMTVRGGFELYHDLTGAPL